MGLVGTSHMGKVFREAAGSCALRLLSLRTVAPNFRNHQQLLECLFYRQIVGLHSMLAKSDLWDGDSESV